MWLAFLPSPKFTDIIIGLIIKFRISLDDDLELDIPLDMISTFLIF